MPEVRRTMHPKIEKYVVIVDFIGAIMGSKTEIVLHDLTKGFEHSVVYIKNNFSGRQIGSPATDFVLDVYKNKTYLEKDFIVNYQTKTLSDKLCYSSSFFIKDEHQNLIGMVCTNTDQSDNLEMKELFETGLSKINQVLNLQFSNDTRQDIVENFYLSPEQMIEKIIFQITDGKYRHGHELKRKQKIEVVRHLYQKGFFDFKESIVKVALDFQMSEISIYKYLQAVKSESEAS